MKAAIKTALLIFVAAITIAGCTTDRTQPPVPGSEAFPMTQALSTVTEQPINPIQE